MSAKFGWRIHDHEGQLAATCWVTEGGDILTVHGFQSRAEAVHFIALHHVLLISSRQDEAARLLREFVGTGRPS